MTPYKLLIVPTDLSEPSLMALDYAVGLAKIFGARIKLVHVYEPLPPFSDTAWGTMDIRQTDEAVLDNARSAVHRVARERVPPDIEIDTATLIGKVDREIVKCAQNEGADLIVMATHGRTGLSHVLMGSNAESVVRMATCPVLTIKPPKHMTSTGEAAGEH